MRTKILSGLLIVSVAVNLVLILIPIVADQYTITSSYMIGWSTRLLDYYKANGCLPEKLPVDIDGVLPLDVLYHRIDGRHATMRARVRDSMMCVVTYIGCDIDISESDSKFIKFAERAIGDRPLDNAEQQNRPPYQ